MAEKKKLETGFVGDPADATLGVPMPESSMPTAAPGAIVLPSRGEMCTCSLHIGIHAFWEELCVNPRRLPPPEDPSGVREIPARDLVKRALMNVPTVWTRDRRERWSAVSYAFGLGSTYSIELCRNFGLDPHEQIGEDPTAEPDESEPSVGTTDVALAHSAFAHGVPMPETRRNWTRAEAEYALDPRPALEVAPLFTKLSEWLEHSRSSGNLHVAIPVDRVEEIIELLSKKSPAAPSEGRPAFTPAVHSTLLEMIAFAEAGKCMACGRPLGDDLAGCKLGNCSFQPYKADPRTAVIPGDEELHWRQRMNVLQLARKYARGEFNR
jgi:hypothetical protein